MERVTFRPNKGNVGYRRFCVEQDALDRLADYEDAEEQGLLVRMPCKVGDTVYECDAIRIYESTIRRIIFETEHIAFDERAIGNTVFLTREKAKAALKAKEKAEDDRDITMDASTFKSRRC